MANFNKNAPYEVRRAHFIERAKAIWGDAFDYTDMQFTTGKEPCVITCRKHGPIRIGMAQNHIMKNDHLRTGCPFCREEQDGIARREAQAVKRAEEEEKRKARKAERERKAAERKEAKMQEFLMRKQYVADHNYDVSSMTDQQINQHYSSIKGSERLLEQGRKAKAERERKKQLQAEERKRKEEERIRKRTADLIAQAIEVHGNKYDYTETTYEKKLYHGKMMWVLANIKCPTHGYFDARPDVHIKMRCGCALCACNYNHMPVEERKQMWIDKCRERFGDRFSYRDVEYVDNDTPVKVFCKEHKYLFAVTPDTHVRGAGGCPYCSASEGEALIRKWLEDNNVNFDPQHQVPNENPDLPLLYLVPDFWLPDYNLFVEMNGQQHYEDIEFFRDRPLARSKREREWSFQQQQLRDETFRKYCQDHNYNLLEIKYDQIERIPQILKRTLKKYAR